MTPNLQKIETLVRQLLIELGEDPAREGLQKTPLRVAQALSFLTQGYRADVRQVINNALFTQDTGGLVTDAGNSAGVAVARNTVFAAASEYVIAYRPSA